MTRALGLELEPEDLAELWMRKNLPAFFAAAKRGGRALNEAPLLARMKRGLRSRGIDLWRAEYAKRNPIAHYYWVRFGKALRTSSSLVERDGFVTFRNRRFMAPGRPEQVPLYAMDPKPELPVLRSQRYRSSRGAEKAYEPWMVACIIVAEGKLKRRVMAELLSAAHGIPPGSPSYRGELFEDESIVELAPSFNASDDRDRDDEEDL